MKEELIIDVVPGSFAAGSNYLTVVNATTIARLALNLLTDARQPTAIRRGFFEMLDSLQASCLDGH